MTNHGPRRTVAELMALYDLEPSVRHLFVEGNIDVAVFTHFLAVAVDAHRTILVSRLDDYVDVAELLSQQVTDEGVRTRLILLARHFESQAVGDGRSKHCLLCIVDRDAGVEESECLMATDYADLELYVWDEERLGHILRLGFGIVDLSELRTTMREVERRAIVTCECRRLIHSLGYGAAGPMKLAKYACAPGEVNISAYLVAHGGRVARNAAQLSKAVKDICQTVDPSDARLHMNGHDVIVIAARMLQNAGFRVNEPELRRLWFTGLEMHDLVAREELFAALVRRAW